VKSILYSPGKRAFEVGAMAQKEAACSTRWDGYGSHLIFDRIKKK